MSIDIDHDFNGPSVIGIVVVLNLEFLRHMEVSSKDLMGSFDLGTDHACFASYVTAQSIWTFVHDVVVVKFTTVSVGHRDVVPIEDRHVCGCAPGIR